MIARRATSRRARAAALGLVALVAACNTPSPTASPTSSPPAPPGSASDATSSTPTSASGSVEPPSDGAAAIDMSLLGLLPPDVDGHPIEPSPEAAAESAANPELAQHADSIAVGVAVDAATDSFVVASVVKLKPGVFDEEFYRDWRDSFDEGVCGQAGGVAGNAEAVIDERTVHIGTCAGGVHTFHVHLEEPDVLVSVNVVGDATLGQQLLETLPD